MNEFLFASQKEAQVFMRYKPTLGYISGGEEAERFTAVWFYMKDDRNFIFLPVFADTKPQELFGKSITTILKGSYFIRQGYLFLVKESPEDGLYVEACEVLSSEKQAKTFALLNGYKDINFLLCRVFTFEQKRRNFVTVIWVGYSQEQNILYCLPAFVQDYALLSQFNLASLMREAVKEGESFIKDGVLYQMYCDEDKEFYFSQKMSILKPNQKFRL